MKHLERTSEQQNSLIIELTSLAADLRSSLEGSRSDLETHAAESARAVEAMALVAIANARASETERAIEAERMELKLERMEDEAVGAVDTVGQAAGRLEYECKVEEEGR